MIYRLESNIQLNMLYIQTNKQVQEKYYLSRLMSGLTENCKACTTTNNICVTMNHAMLSGIIQTNLTVRLHLLLLLHGLRKQFRQRLLCLGPPVYTLELPMLGSDVNCVFFFRNGKQDAVH